MGTLVMKFIAILALVIAAMISPAANIQVVLGFAIFVSAGAVAIQAMQNRKYPWAILFCGIAMVFNPVLTVPPQYSRHAALAAACIFSFVLSLFMFGNMPKKTIASITTQRARRRSL